MDPDPEIFGVVPTVFVALVEAIKPEFKKGEQHDAQEFFLFVLNTLPELAEVFKFESSRDRECPSCKNVRATSVSKYGNGNLVFA